MDPKPAETPAPSDAGGSFQARIVAGLLLALPIAVTSWIIYQLYSTLQALVLDPVAKVVQLAAGAGLLRGLPVWWERYFAPFIAVGLVLVALYFLGIFARSRAARLLDWILLHLPVVSVVFRAVRNVFKSLDDSRRGAGFKRVVLVPFPHPGSKALAFVTKTLRDADTQRTILCVCVLTGVIPPTGFTLFVPEDDAIDIDWTVHETLEAIVSGGITAPGVIRFHTGGPTRLIVPGAVAEG